MRPTVGKEKPGITFLWKELCEILRGHQPYPQETRELRQRPLAIPVKVSRIRQEMARRC